MPQSQAVTETIILYVKEDINLEYALSEAGDSGSPAAKAFAQLTNTVKAQQGFIRQYWGHQVEDSSLFLWYIDWESLEYHQAFSNSEAYKSFMVSLGWAFKLENAAPLMMYTRWTSNPAAALQSPVTEIAFLTLPNDAGEEAKTTIEQALVPIMGNVTTIGKSWGAAIGWVLDVASKHHAATPEGHSIALHGVFGYESIEDHMRWRETPEHAEAIKIMGSLVSNLSLGSADIQGKDMFHVKFRKGT